MALRIGINGFGRIGRAVTRQLHERDGVAVVAINDLTEPAQLAHALQYDSVYHRFNGRVDANGDRLAIGDWQVRVSAIKDPAQIDWRAAGVDIVIEATGVFKRRADLEKHLAAGARQVVLCVPPKDELDATIVMGANDHLLRGDERLVSNASCTTNAAAPLTKVIHENFRVQRGCINTVHAYTNGQRLVDTPHKDWRRSRAAALSIIPTTTGAARAVTKVIPELEGKLDGMAYRVPVPVGSIVDMTFEVADPVTVEAVNQAVLQASKNQMKGIIEYQSDPLVSADIVGNTHSSIFDSLLTQVVDGRLLKVASWYDNEWGYSARVADLAVKLHELAGRI